MKKRKVLFVSLSLLVFVSVGCLETTPVAPPPETAVTDVTLDPQTLSLTTEDDPVVLDVTVLPDDATDGTVSWSSSNTAVATVSSSGAVTPKSPGTATVSATSVDGNTTGTCEVTVAAVVVEPIIGTWTITNIEETGTLTQKTLIDGVDSIIIVEDTTITMFTNERVSNYTTNGWRLDTYIFGIRDSVQYQYQAIDSTVITTLGDGTTETAKFSLDGNVGQLTTPVVDTLSASTDGQTGTRYYTVLTGVRVETLTKQ